MRIQTQASICLAPRCSGSSRDTRRRTSACRRRRGPRDGERGGHGEGALDLTPALGRRCSSRCSARRPRWPRSIALGKQVYDLTGRELDLGLLGLADAPALLLVFVTGPVADRFDRRTIGRLALGLEAVFCVAPWCTRTATPRRWPDLRPRRRVRHRPRLRDARHARCRPTRCRLNGSVAGRPPVGHLAGGVDRRTGRRGILYAADVQLPFVMVVGLLVVSAGALHVRYTDARRRAPPATQRGDDAVPREAPSRRVSVHDAEGIRFSAPTRSCWA